MPRIVVPTETLRARSKPVIPSILRNPRPSKRHFTPPNEKLFGGRTFPMFLTSAERRHVVNLLTFKTVCTTDFCEVGNCPRTGWNKQKDGTAQEQGRRTLGQARHVLVRIARQVLMKRQSDHCGQREIGKEETIEKQESAKSAKTAGSGTPSAALRLRRKYFRWELFTLGISCGNILSLFKYHAYAQRTEQFKERMLVKIWGMPLRKWKVILA